jgi:hypothetical protein
MGRRDGRAGKGFSVFVTESKIESKQVIVVSILGWEGGATSKHGRVYWTVNNTID